MVKKESSINPKNINPKESSIEESSIKGCISLKEIQVIHKEGRRRSNSIRAMIIQELRNNRDKCFYDRYFCEKYGIINQQVNQVMHQLEIKGLVERVLPQCPDPYNQLMFGTRVATRWIKD